MSDSLLHIPAESGLCRAILYGGAKSKYNIMAKKSFHFDIAIPMPGIEFSKPVNHGDLEISGVGYFWPNEDPENQFDFDIDQVHMRGADVIGLLKFLEGSPKEVPFIYDPCMAHVQKHFHEYTLNPVS